jgi:ureidoacrylate peracid hydrolase
MSGHTTDLQTRLSRRTALVVVDMQKDYCVAGGIIDRLGGDISGSAALAERLQAFLDEVRSLVELTVFVRTEIPAVLHSPALAEQYARTSLKREIATNLSDWYRGVQPTGTDVVVTKQRYSPFVDTPFPAMLRAARIETLIVAGVTTEVCVESTVRDAFMRDYSVVVASDGTQGSTAERHDHSLKLMDIFFARVANGEEILTALRARKPTGHDRG